MLNKIRNIKPGSDYRKAGKFKGFENATRLIESSLINISDSKQLSPALKFLAKNNWKLINLKFNNNENLLLTLKIGDYEFTTLIDVLNFSNIENLSYDITVQFDDDEKKIKYQAKFISHITYSEDTPDFSNINLTPLETLFERYVSLNIYTELNQTDSSLIKSLVIDIKKELEILFDYINEIFLTFICKLTQLPKIEKFGSENYSEQSVTLIQIKYFI